MTIQPSKKEFDVRYFKLYGLTVAVVGIAVGVFVLLGWALDVEVLKSLLKNKSTMKPNTAVCFIFSGIALLIISRCSERSEVAHRIKQQPGLEKVVLAALTGWGQEEDRRRTTEAGFDFHLVKPLKPKALESLLDSLIHPSNPDDRCE